MKKSIHSAKMAHLNAYLFHTMLISAQPLYLLYKWAYLPEYFTSVSTTRLAIGILFWVYLITRITIPMLTSPLLRLPFPKGDIFPIGHAWLMQEQQPPEQIVKICNETPNDGIIAFWDPLYLRVRVVLTTPPTIMDALNNHGYDWHKPTLAKKLLRRILGEGLINVEGNVHKAMRKTAAPAFSGRQIRDLVPLFWSKGLDLADSMAREINTSSDGEAEMMDQMSRVTLDIIGAAAIGMDFKTINGDENKLARLYATVTGTNRGPIIPFFLINVLLPPWFVKRLRGTIYARVANATQELRDNIQDLLAVKKRNLKQNSAGHNDIIGTIIRSGDFSDEYLCDQLLTFFAAGHDTTASALTWTTWFLSRHQNIQDRLRAECDEHLSGLSTIEITADTFDEMPYLTAVCNETLRLYPTVPLTARNAAVDTKVGNFIVPKGTEALISPWVSNRDTSLWGEDAKEYNPDRWLEGSLAASGGANNPYAFLTFLYGPRSCIGQSFSRTEMKCLLAVLVMRFKIEPSATQFKIKIAGFVTIKPKGGLKLRLRDLKESS